MNICNIKESINNIQIGNNKSGKINEQKGIVNGDSYSDMVLKNDNISIMGNNNALAETKNGNISVMGFNANNLITKNGNISLMGENKYASSIITKNGDISNNNINNGYIKTKNGNIITIKNNGILVNSNGAINIYDYLYVYTDKINMSISSNNISISGGGDISIINNNVYINGVKQDKNNIDSNNKHIINIEYIDNLNINKNISIDFIKKEINIDNITYNKSNILNDIMNISNDVISIIVNDQIIKITEQNTIVEYIKS